MTLLRPTPSRRRWVRRVPLWALVVGVALSGLLIVGIGLLFGLGGDEGTGADAAAASDECAPDEEQDARPPRASDGGRVNVYNATDRDGLAAATAAELGDRGFTVGRVGNDPLEAKISSAAEVRHGPAAADQARWVAAHVPGSELRELDRGNANVDLVLGDAFEEVVRKKAARKAYAESANEVC